MFTPPLIGYVIVGTYDLWLFFLSYALATFASFTSLELATRIKTSSGTARKIWIGGCAFTMGGGIWSMHFTGMLAFELPMEVTYNIWVTLLSFIVAVVASGIGFSLVHSRKHSLMSNVIKGGGVMGGGIALMHYTGMAAMKIPGSMHYKPGLFILSLIIAFVAASAALALIQIFGNREGELKFTLKLFTALIMGLAVFGMHYTGMAATSFSSTQAIAAPLMATSDFRMLAFGISGTTFFILGMTVLVLATQREIQKLVEAKNQLEKRIEVLPKLPEQNPFPVIQVDRVGTILYANLAGEKALAHWNCEILGPIHDDFDGMVKDVFDYKDSNPLKIDIGKHKYVFDAVYSKDQDRINLYGTNITDLESSREALVIQRQNFYDMLDNLPICFNLLAPDYSVPYANKMFRERFGHPEDKKCFELMSKREEACDVCSPLKVFDDKKKRSSIWNSTDGRTYLKVCTPFIGSEGEKLVMEMAMDITDQEKSKIEAVKAKEEAEKANQAKSEFLARMSHELRTPMNAILGFTQLLQMDNKNPLVDYQMKNMERVSSAGHHLLTLINEILDLSRIESGLIDLTIERQDLVPIVNDVISLSMPLADEKGITLEYEELSESCFAEIDPLRFKQVVLNIISNAIKYNRPNGSVTLSYEKQKNGIMRLGIEDTGCGIPEENRDKLFQPFERLDMNRKNIEGVGIGLAISRKFIELMGGTIDFDSVEGKGSFFYIDIPISSKESDPVVF